MFNKIIYFCIYFTALFSTLIIKNNKYSKLMCVLVSDKKKKNIFKEP